MRRRLLILSVASGLACRSAAAVPAPASPPDERATAPIAPWTNAAGTGASAWTGDMYDAWPVKREFADGSRVGYGPEGGTGPTWLAYVRIPGQDCLCNVWSRFVAWRSSCGVRGAGLRVGAGG